MFRVQENDDGSTGIFCKTTNKLICTIRGQQRGQSVGVTCPIPRPVNVVEPSRKLLENSNSNDEISDEAYISDSDVKPNVGYLTNRVVPCISLPPLLPKEVIEDFSDDCITQEQFARCLNLVSTNKFKKKDKKKLRAEFPLRLHSRTEPLFISDDLRDLKFPDDMPLTSCLGMKILQLNYNKNFINDQAISFAIKKYDTFCRFPINTVKVSSCSFPKLRCREKKEYPVCIPQKILKLEVNHKYSYGKRQRQERIMTLKTGLDKRSRKLLKLCQSRKSEVHLERLTEEQIKKMTERKPQKFPVIEIPQSSFPSFNNDISSSDEEIDVVLDSSDDDIQIVDPPHISQKYSYEKANFQSDNCFLENKNVYISSFASNSFPASKSLLFNGSRLKIRSSNNLKMKKCFVKLHNVLHKIHKHCDHYFIKGTSVRVPFLVQSLMSSPNFNVKHLYNGNQTMVGDHSYHKSTPKKGFIHDSFSFRSAEKNRNNTVICPAYHKTNNSPFKPFSTKISKTCKGNGSPGHSCGNALSVPIVDLTDDTSPDSTRNTDFIPMPYDVKITRWLFHCFGCGLKRIYNSEASKDSAINEHMRSYHSVSDPETFLLPYMDNVNHCLITEAFPGYKSEEENSKKRE